MSILWLEQVLPDEMTAQPLQASTGADVAIIGGGYVGLWTAIHIKRLEPACDVVVLEQGICGGGASGRNGGFVLTWWPKIDTLVALCGDAEAVRLARASEQAIDEIGAFLRGRVHRCASGARRVDMVGRESRAGRCVGCGVAHL